MLTDHAQDWINYLNYKYMNTYAPTVKVFKLDKTATSIDPLYGEESSSRIYLQPFEISALYDNGEWAGFLGLQMFSEEQQPQRFHVNFDDMVSIIQDKKNDHVSEIKIKYTGNEIPEIEKNNDKVNLYLNGSLNTEIDLNIYRTTKKLSEYINSLLNWQSVYLKNNDKSVNIVNFNKTKFTNTEIIIYSLSQEFSNVSDVIEIGDVVLNNKNRLFEVRNASPSGEFGWEYSTWMLECEYAQIDQVILPGDYINLIKENNYNLQRTETE